MEYLKKVKKRPKKCENTSQYVRDVIFFIFSDIPSDRVGGFGPKSWWGYGFRMGFRKNENFFQKPPDLCGIEIFFF